MNLSAPKVVVLGMMTRSPVAGVVWQTIHYLEGLRRLGCDPYYVEAHGINPSMLMGDARSDGSAEAAAFLDVIFRRFDLGGRWAFHALHADGRCYGMTASQLRRLYRSAALVINLHGGTVPREEHAESGRLVYLETDPVALQIELHHGKSETIEFLEPHAAFFTFGESYGGSDCALPVSDRFAFRPTRQPVVLDYWKRADPLDRGIFTTIGNWQQRWREVTFAGQRYQWSKREEFLRFLDLPARAGQPFELAVSSCSPADRRMLQAHGWRVRRSLEFSSDLSRYRHYIARSHGEFTVAKDQNVRLRSGWFSDRSATYLASGKPVITQDTGFGNHLPTGEGLFAFTDLDDILHAVDAVAGDYVRHCKAASAIAQEYFSHDVVLKPLLAEVGL